MKTKLVYVLTCAPEGNYIEQALVSVWSARYHNPDAHIVLIVDDKTSQLLVGKRGEVLNYVTETKVVSFAPDKNAHFRSRWLKTSVRELVEGNFLFIDCDTIVMRDLSSIEDVDAQIAMVRDENINLADELVSTLQPIVSVCDVMGVDITREVCYFNSGVMFVRDTPMTHHLYKLWHKYWEEGLANGLPMDQPSFAKANIESGRPVVLLPDIWNCLVFTQIPDIYNHPFILHFWHGVSFLYKPAAMAYTRENGLTDFIKYYVLHPTETFIPFNNRVCRYKFKDYIKLYNSIRRVLRDYGQTIDSRFDDFEPRTGFFPLVLKALVRKWYRLGSMLIVAHKWYFIKLSGKFKYKDNYYKAVK